MGLGPNLKKIALRSKKTEIKEMYQNRIYITGFNFQFIVKSKDSPQGAKFH